MKNIIFVAHLVFCCFFWNQSVAQQLDPIHYPPESEWEYLKTKNTDSLIQVMKFYFLSDDTLFFREAISQQVVKVSVKDLQRTSIYIGQDYAFANRFYGPGGATASRTSKNEKLDRFYYYYLNSPELKFSKAASVLPIEQTEMELTDSTAAHQETLPVTSIPVQNTKPRSALRPQIVLKNGGILYPENFYFLSDGQLYFGNGVRENVFKVDTNAVEAVIGIEVGENLRLMSGKKNMKRGGGLVVLGIYLGAINLGIVASAIASEYSQGMAVFTSIPTAIVYYQLIAKGIKRSRNYKRFKYAKYAQIAN
ncbi:MAG: hypothetical protein ACKO5N_04965 [Sphingomonadales bacterium]